MNNLGLIISESIKTGKWIHISYKNKENEVTFFWIAIKDIDLKRKLLTVDIFNDTKSLYSIKNSTIHAERIQQAKLLDFTTYVPNEALIKKIETNKEDAKWLHYENFNNNILKYYIKCNELDNDPYQTDSFTIPGIDKDVLLKRKRMVLNDTQIVNVIRYIKQYNNKKREFNFNNLILSFLSIEVNRFKKYIVLYYDVTYNPSERSLFIDPTPRVNKTFLIDDKKHSIGSYIDIDPNEFVYNIVNKLDVYLKEYTELIRSNLRDNEIINEMPEFMVLERSIPANLLPTYTIIYEKYNKGDLDYPLKAFFGNCNRRGKLLNDPAIVIYDRKVNIDQMKVIYNATKYPVTYVQGPPGTGKTQTILNVVLSSFYNSRTTLICSSNNKPIDGIIEKLTFTYNNEMVPFPYLRLGNREEVAKSTKRIIDLYNYPSSKYNDLIKIKRIKRTVNQGNKELVNQLSIYEKRNDLRQKIDSAQKLLDSLIVSDSYLYKNVKEQIDVLTQAYNTLKEVTNNDVLSLVNKLTNDDSLKKYIYYESIDYIRKLKFPRYNELIKICSIEKDEDRVTEFNKWCSLDSNIRLLEQVFPVIITTNISAARLGTANHTFDMVIMDEAGQCNAATALLPIARAKRLLLVGDTNQLKPVIVLEDYINTQLKEEYGIKDDYDYAKNSILDIMKTHDKISKDIMLTYHYRCGKKIINYSNQRFYDSKLNLDNIAKEGNLELIPVKNMNSRLRNENYEEACAIIDYLKENKPEDVAIITPFKNQQNLINKLLQENHIENVTCGTIHSVQGGEKSTIIISSSISPKTSAKTFDWIKNNSEITNVAVTRAKDNLIVVSDVEAVKALSTNKDDDLYNLINYIQNNGSIKIEPNESHMIQIGNSNGSINEDMFFETIRQFCSVNPTYQGKRNVKVASLFGDDPLLSKSRLEFDVVLYQIDDTRLIPRVAIELQGGEHYGDYKREKCDTRKSQICKQKGIKLLEIPNSFAKSYETIKELLLSSCGNKSEQMELF